jgi:energy-converting hydrogenase A subunit M
LIQAAQNITALARKRSTASLEEVEDSFERNTRRTLFRVWTQDFELMIYNQTNVITNHCNDLLNKFILGAMNSQIPRLKAVVALL